MIQVASKIHHKNNIIIVMLLTTSDLLTRIHCVIAVPLHCVIAVLAVPLHCMELSDYAFYLDQEQPIRQNV
jgi:hypothetical protein